MQIIIQKKYIVAYEVAENIFAVFLVIMNFVFNIVQKVRDGVEEIVKYVKNIFTKFEQTLQKLDTTFYYQNVFVKSNFVIYSNLLAPPIRL